ncbi:hypothetical protein GOP47_0006059 [Adiantum capillus-veneris]|uniref:Uncharacterized protein n=1 Tax=Adiantum capillus-veneris TaxID=13818 RepID=A0A9D4V2C5_ADICA|nr:hypothetical protein GOP47_0006059 [Adiantum capillus-veneris]
MTLCVCQGAATLRHGRKLDSAHEISPNSAPKEGLDSEADVSVLIAFFPSVLMPVYSDGDTISETYEGF